MKFFDALDNFFKKQVTFTFGTLLSIVFCLLAIIIHFSFNEMTMLLLVGLVCVALLFISYRKYFKNVEKPLVGALFMLLIVVIVDNLFSMFKPEVTLSGMNGFLRVVIIIFDVIAVLAIITIFFLHLKINTRSQSSPNELKINQIACLALIGGLLTALIFYLFSGLVEIKYVFAQLFVICLAATLVSFESILDEFRLKRTIDAQETTINQ